MPTWFITMRGPSGRDVFRSTKRDTEEEALREANYQATRENLTVVSVRPLRTGLKSVGKPRD